MNYTKTFITCLLSALVVLVVTAGTSDAGSLLVSSKGTNQILQYNLETGAFEKVFADAAVLGSDPQGGNLLTEPTGMDIGPDGNVYVAYRDGIGDPTTGGVLRFAPNGTFIDIFSLAVTNIGDMDFGPDGNMYVTKSGSGVHCILGPDSATPGELDPNHTSIGAVGAVEPFFNATEDAVTYFRSITHAGGQVRVSNKGGTTLEIFDVPFATQTDVPWGVEIGPDNILYCVSNNASPPTDVAIYTMDYFGGETEFTQLGDGHDADPALDMPLGIAFDDDGNILVSSHNSSSVAKFSTVDGTFLGNLVEPEAGGLLNPHYGLTVLPPAGPADLPGDANYDGVVNDADAEILADNWMTATGASWGMGDFNEDGAVDDIDATILATNWQAAAAGGSSVPEPSTLVLLTCGLLALLLRRRS